MDFMKEMNKIGKSKNYGKATDEIDSELAAILGD